MRETYLPYVNGGRWAISRNIGGRVVALVQDSYLHSEVDAKIALWALGMSAHVPNLDTYFPYQGSGGRCPTLEFLELFSRLGSGVKTEVGV